jgi:hypothetical protein
MLAEAPLVVAVPVPMVPLALPAPMPPTLPALRRRFCVSFPTKAPRGRFSTTIAVSNFMKFGKHERNVYNQKKSFF